MCRSCVPASTTPNSADVFQLDQLFREKLRSSAIEPYSEVEAKVEGETEKRLLTQFRL